MSRVITAILMLFIVSTASGFENNAMRFDRLSSDDGLSQSSVMAVQQDKTGFMWFATENGLDRYDGFTFQNYRNLRGQEDSLSDNFARDLDVASDGSLWIATDGGGVSRWIPDSDRFVSWRHNPGDTSSLATDRIRTVLTDPRGYVWIGTRDSGLDRLEISSGHITHFAHVADDANSISNNEVYSLALGVDGVLWIGTKAGLNRLDPDSGRITRFVNDPDDASSLSGDDVRSLLVDHEGMLWIGTSKNGLSRFDSSSNSFKHFSHSADDYRSITSNRIQVIFEDNEQRLWVGSNRGLNLLNRDTGDFLNYRNDPKDAFSLSSDDIFSIFQDRGGILWVGTRNNGLNKWNPRSWSFGHYKPSTMLKDASFSPNVMSFAEDSSGRLWVAAFGGGLNIMDREGGSITQIRNDPEVAGSLSDNRVMVLTAARDGKIWAGTMTDGLNRIDPKTGVVDTFRHDPSDESSLAADGVMSLYEDRAGVMWIGTYGGGVSRLDPGTDHFVNYNHDPADDKTLSSPRATSIVEDSYGQIWVGTDGGGLNLLDRKSGTWQHFVHDESDAASLSTNTVYALHADPDGGLWIGTRAGLNRLSSARTGASAARFEIFSARDSLSNDAVYSIERSSAGALWLGTSRGLVQFQPNSGKVRRFHASQGLQGDEFNFGASYASRSGELFFGGSNGFNAFNPANLQFNREPPPVVLTSLSVLNKPVSSGQPYELVENIDLNYKDDVVTFGISALDYSAPAENRYAYRLIGFNDEWVDAGNERRITYTNLDGGNYRLQVRAANGDGYWNNDGISIPLRVEFPPWKTWWAYTLYAAAMIIALLGFLRFQQKKLMREAEYSRRLEQEVRERTDELKNRNSDLKKVNEKLLMASTTDPLTGLRNRRYLFQQIVKDVDLVLRHYRDGTETLSPSGNNDLLFLMVDLDNFKPVNDSCGHEAGDELLLQIRDVLLEASRSSDDVIRWGGDEFLVVARDTNRKNAATLAERIRSSLSQRVFPIGNGQVARCTASIGYASFPFIKDQPELLQWEDVLGIADAAMYEAKQKRNAWMGIEGIDWYGTGDEFCRAIKASPGDLASEGYIQAVESVEDVVKDVG
ncbi:MAG: two-component regulator propeller domain-containing protein [Woeseiaceae bacterium]